MTDDAPVLSPAPEPEVPGPPPPPAPTGAPAVATPAERLPKGALIAAPIVFVVTAVVGIALIALALVTFVDAVGDFRQVRPGETRTLLLDPGDWYVVVGGPTGSVAATRVVVVDPTGQPPERVSDPVSVDVDLDGVHFESVDAFRVPRSGRYAVTVEGPPDAEVRIGRVPLTRFLVLLVGGIAVGGIGFLAALVTLVVGLVVRSGAKKRRADVAATTVPPTPPTPPT